MTQATDSELRDVLRELVRLKRIKEHVKYNERQAEKPDRAAYRELMLARAARLRTVYEREVGHAWRRAREVLRKVS
jgi:hypothetical protein